MLLANEATYRSLSTFESVEELNEAIKIHRTNNQLSATERAVLELISRYACKYVGVCYLSKNNIAEAVGRVRRTVIRACNRLEALGIIKQYETKRDGGDRRQSTNVIVVLPLRISQVGDTCHSSEYVRLSHEVETMSSQAKCPTSGSMPRGTKRRTSSDKDKMSESAEVTPDMSRHKTPSNKLNNINYINTYYKPFYARFKAFIGSTIGKDSQRIISRLYGVYLSHSKPLLAGNAFDKGSVEHIGFQALKTAVMATKNKRIKNLAGYFNGILDRMLDKLYFGEMGELGGL
ncbi:putative transcriptional regulator [Lederbergia galactosidilyticus]|uniref:helix-turn-helix domain-containing protein n=1 Tax=Lederbergia galactosidilytica TaxID=217031 RepID=UPI001AE3A833|nr:helix-turn-helix domain-containing protein [Lederbergia galactosidilytica]MBP1913263.1 putative transcriptional regulator [Lederbergia galactosidilytica]